MTLRAASSMVSLAVSLKEDGPASSRTLREVGSQWPREPISIVCNLEVGPFASRSLRACR